MRTYDAEADVFVNGFAELNQLARPDSRLVIVSGEGAMVRDDRGNEYIDAVSGMWAAGFGFRNQDLIDAAVEQLSLLACYHGSADKATPAILEFSERLAEVAPGDARRVLLVNGGSEANDTQLKLLSYLRDSRGEASRSAIVVHDRAYHGASIASGSMSDVGPSGKALGLTWGEIVRIESPFYRLNHAPGETESEFVDRLVQQFEQVIAERGAESISAIFCEPVLGAGGIIVPPDGYYERMCSVARRHGIRVVADEVITGFGRTGEMWGSTSFGIEPESTTYAKAITGGVIPAGAVTVDTVMHEAMMEQSAKYGIFAHGFTSGGHPVSAAVGLRVLDIMREQKIVPHIQSLAPAFAREMDTLRSLPHVWDVRGVGLMWAVQMSGNEAGADLVKRVVDEAAARGLIVRGIDDMLCMCLPAIVDEEIVVAVASKLRDAILAAGASQ